MKILDSYKYNLSPTLWISPFCKVYKCINDYVTDFIVNNNNNNIQYLYSAL